MCVLKSALHQEFLSGPTLHYGGSFFTQKSAKHLGIFKPHKTKILKFDIQFRGFLKITSQKRIFNDFLSKI